MNNFSLLYSGHVVREGRDELNPHEIGRWSIFGFKPKEEIRAEFEEGDLDDLWGEVNNINSVESRSRPARTGGLDLPFAGGWIGYFSYDFGVRMNGLEQKSKNERSVPDYVWRLYLDGFCYDHENEEMCFFGDCTEKDLKDFDFGGLFKPDSRDQPENDSSEGTIKVKSNITKEQYAEAIGKIKQKLKDGETYQVNFSQRFHVARERRDQDDWRLFKKLMKVNPSPFSCYLPYEDFSIVSCSPERLVRYDGKYLDSRPIKGTVKKDEDKNDQDSRDKPENDKVGENAQSLLDSEKDKAELTMIVDLVRNDLGRVCEVGTVEVTEHRVLEEYSHVIHTVSNVRGVLSDDKDFPSIIRSLFPGGSITGCPKYRTMQIIDELEGVCRGIYTGSAGYIGLDGRFDLNILIRTFECWKATSLASDVEDKLYFHSGGGIVYDSKSENEYEETLDKAEALLEALSFNSS